MSTNINYSDNLRLSGMASPGNMSPAGPQSRSPKAVSKLQSNMLSPRGVGGFQGLNVMPTVEEGVMGQ